MSILEREIEFHEIRTGIYARFIPLPEKNGRQVWHAFLNNEPQIRIAFGECPLWAYPESKSDVYENNVEDIIELTILSPINPVADESGNVLCLFKGYSSLEKIQGLANIDLTNATNTEAMFAGCSSLVSIDGAQSWDMSNITQMTGMFDACESLTDISAMRDWDVSNVEDISMMFYGCSALEDISALSNWDVSNVKTMGHVFTNCESITSLSPIAEWDVSNVDHMIGFIRGCSDIEDISEIEHWRLSGNPITHSWVEDFFVKPPDNSKRDLSQFGIPESKTAGSIALAVRKEKWIELYQRIRKLTGKNEIALKDFIDCYPIIELYGDDDAIRMAYDAWKSGVSLEDICA